MTVQKIQNPQKEKDQEKIRRKYQITNNLKILARLALLKTTLNTISVVKKHLMNKYVQNQGSKGDLNDGSTRTHSNQDSFQK